MECNKTPTPLQRSKQTANMWITVAQYPTTQHRHEGDLNEHQASQEKCRIMSQYQQIPLSIAQKAEILKEKIMRSKDNLCIIRYKPPNNSCY